MQRGYKNPFIINDKLHGCVFKHPDICLEIGMRIWFNSSHNIQTCQGHTGVIKWHFVCISFQLRYLTELWISLHALSTWVRHEWPVVSLCGGSVGNCLADKLSKWAVCIWSTAGMCGGFLTHVTRGVCKCEQWRLVGSMHDCPWRANDADGGEWASAHEEHATRCHPSSHCVHLHLHTYTNTVSLLYFSLFCLYPHQPLFALNHTGLRTCVRGSRKLCSGSTHEPWSLISCLHFSGTTFRVQSNRLCAFLVFSGKEIVTQCPLN